MTSALDNLAAGFLVASPALKDPNFDHSVVLMCLHNDQGAMGLVINRVAPMSTGELLRQVGIEPDSEHDTGQPVMIGGPVSVEHGILLYRAAADDPVGDEEISIADDLRLCPNQSLLQQIAAGNGPTFFHIFLGHAGWAPGQLEQEISQGAWIPAQLRLDLIFDTPVSERWESALRAEGLTPAALGAFRPQS
jgi:putative transcriptional regulator